MKKAEISTLVNACKRNRRDTLTKAVAGLVKIQEERDLTHRMYFWSDFGNAGSRAYFRKRYDTEFTVKLSKDVQIVYSRTVGPSRNNAYAKDTIVLLQGKDEQSLTAADCRKIADGLTAIVDSRK